MRDFNIAGPIIAEDHYHIPPLERLDLEEVLRLIERKLYFVLHAPRQTGKTTALLALMELLNSSERYRCVYINVEIGQSAREDVGAAMRAILRALAQEEEAVLGSAHLRGIWPDALDAGGPHNALQESLSRWAKAEEKPLVLFVDEIDALVGDTLIAVLRQLRAGYPKRPRRYPHSIVLCGVRDVRDYRIWSSAENAVVLGGSAFNVKARSLRLGNFSKPQTFALLRQHTEATEQQFHEDALDEVWHQTRGQPWLVNALADEACFRSEAGRNRRQPIAQSAIRDAVEQLVLRRETHLDQLARQLEDERVRRVIEPLLCGDAGLENVAADDIEYVRDLGLVSRQDPMSIANPIYRDVCRDSSPMPPKRCCRSMRLGTSPRTAGCGWMTLMRSLCRISFAMIGSTMSNRIPGPRSGSAVAPASVSATHRQHPQDKLGAHPALFRRHPRDHRRFSVHAAAGRGGTVDIVIEMLADSRISASTRCAWPSIHISTYMRCPATPTNAHLPLFDREGDKPWRLRSSAARQEQ